MPSILLPTNQEVAGSNPAGRTHEVLAYMENSPVPFYNNLAEKRHTHDQGQAENIRYFSQR